MTLRTKTNIKRGLHAVLSNTKARTYKRTITKFSDKFGLIYFGPVNQHTDDHKVVRGFTVSSTHKDNSYSVGSINGYDITLVDRSDTVRQANKITKSCNWIIMAFDLHTEVRIPHFLIGANNYDMQPYGALFSTFPNMQDIGPDLSETKTNEFSSRFTIYARPAKTREIEELFPLEITRMLGVHLWPLSVEQHDNVLYVYSVNAKVTSVLLETMLKNGLWLAENLDLRAELL